VPLYKKYFITAEVAEIKYLSPIGRRRLVIRRADLLSDLKRLCGEYYFFVLSGQALKSVQMKNTRGYKIKKQPRCPTLLGCYFKSITFSAEQSNR